MRLQNFAGKYPQVTMENNFKAPHLDSGDELDVGDYASTTPDPSLTTYRAAPFEHPSNSNFRCSTQTSPAINTFNTIATKDSLPQTDDVSAFEHSSFTLSRSSATPFVPSFLNPAKFSSFQTATKSALPPSPILDFRSFGKVITGAEVISGAKPISDSETVSLSAKLENGLKTSVLVDSVGLPVILAEGIRSKPFFLAPTNFKCRSGLKVDQIVQITTSCLEGCLDVDFEYHSISFDWTAVLVRGSTFVKFEVRLYSDVDSSYIIEANRLTGDACAFYPVYHELCSAFNNGESRPERGFDSFASSAPMPGSHDLLSDEEAAEALRPVIRMAQDPSRESQFAAAQIMCDLSVQVEMQQQLSENGCISLLSKLALSPCESTRRLAIIALSNLSECTLCQAEIVKSGILPELFLLVKDGPYYTAEMRRAGARILAQVSARLACEVASKVGREDLTRWMDTIDAINDDKLKLQANRARSSFQAVFAN